MDLTGRVGHPFHFPVLSSHVSSHASPFEDPEHLLSLSAVLAPTMYTVLVEDKSATFLSEFANWGGMFLVVVASSSSGSSVDFAVVMVI